MSLPIEQVLVNFSADWCSPCRDVLPVFRSLAEKYTSIMFLIVDVDELAVSYTQPSLLSLQCLNNDEYLNTSIYS